MRSKASLIAGSIVLGLIVGGGAAAEPLKLAHSTWVGYGPLYIAKEKGFFEEEGLEVELIVMEDPKVRFAALAAGQIDILVTTVDTVLNYLSDQQGYRYLFALDDSKGGDGIVANKDIQTIGTWTHLIMRCSTPEDLVYKITKSLAKNTDHLGNVVAAVKGLTAKNLAHDVGVPYHPGARKFYREAKVM